MVDKNEIEGAGKRIKGKARQAAGKIRGDRKEQLQGAGEELEGELQQDYGHAKDEVKKETRKRAA
ncbi:MAG: CsbD family protein [Terriglobales bacterium]